MSIKKKVLNVVTVSFLSLLLVSTFLSKTIYYYTHEKVTAVTVSNGFIINEFENINASLVIDGGDNIIFPVKLREPLVVKKIMVSNSDYVSENEAIMLFDIDSVKIARNYILADIENCEMNIPINSAELAALKEQLRIFDSHIDENGNLRSRKSGFITDIKLIEGGDFSGAGLMCAISNEETNYLIELNFSIEQGSFINYNCEITLQKDETLIKGLINKIVYTEKDCSVVVKPNNSLTEEDAMEIFLDNAVLPMDIKTSSGRYETIVPVEAIIDNQYIYIIKTVENFLGSRTVNEKIYIQILATNGEMVAVDIKNQRIMPDSKVITSKPKLLGGEEIVVLY
jgi:hypothetical protein